MTICPCSVHCGRLVAPARVSCIINSASPWRCVLAASSAYGQSKCQDRQRSESTDKQKKKSNLFSHLHTSMICLGEKYFFAFGIYKVKPCKYMLCSALKSVGVARSLRINMYLYVSTPTTVRKIREGSHTKIRVQPDPQQCIRASGCSEGGRQHVQLQQGHLAIRAAKTGTVLGIELQRG